MSLGLRVCGLGFRVSDLGLLFEGLFGFRVFLMVSIRLVPLWLVFQSILQTIRAVEFRGVATEVSSLRFGMVR